MDSRRGYQVAVDAVLAHWKTRAKMMSRTEEIAQVAIISVNQKREVGNLIALATEKVGRYGVTIVSRKPRAPEFNHQITRKALKVNWWPTPAWAKARLQLLTQGRLQSRASYATENCSKDTAHGSGSRHKHSTGSISATIGIMKKSLQQGITTDSFTFVNALRMCLKEQDLLATKQVHDLMIESGMDKNPFVANTLVNVYIKCGGFLDAVRVFDRLEKKSVMTWNLMIAGYVQREQAESALELFNQMRQEGAQPNEVTYLRILKACASPSALKWRDEVHACIRHSGLESSVRVGTALLQMYAKCGRLKEAKQVFESLTNRDVVAWNSMIGAYAEDRRGLEAYRLFLQMRQEGFEPDAVTYMSILNPRASVGALEWVKEIHGHARNAGLESDLRVANALVNMYAKSGSIDDARLIFERMEERNVVTWTAMIGGVAQYGCGHEAYRLFLQMSEEGVQPNAITYMSISNASASEMPLEWVKKVHGHARKAGLESDVRVSNALVHMYAKSCGIVEARQNFYRIEKRDVVTWNTIIGGLVQHGCQHEAYALFLEMGREGFQPNAITYLNFLNASPGTMPIELVKEVHEHARKAGLDLDVRVGNALIHMYAKSGNIDDARLVFERMVQRNIVTWNVMIGGLAQHGCGHEAYRLFLQMRQEGLRADAITFMNILNPCASVGALEWVKGVHGHARRAGLVSDLRVANALIHMYAKSGGLDDARLTFHSMEKRDIVTWTVMIGGLAQHGYGHEALELFRRMIVDRLRPDETSFAAVLSSCCHSGLLDDGRRLFLAMTKIYGVEPNIVHYNCMVDLLGRAGHLEEANLFIGDMPVKPDAVTWKALLGGCRTHANVELGEGIAKELLQLEPDDDSAYVLLSNIYAAGGKWEKASWVRAIMQNRGVRKEPGCTWIEVDNQVHKFLAGAASHPEAKEIYRYMKDLTGKLKAEGYIADTQSVLQNIDEENKELALWSHSEKLAIVYGLMRVPQGQPIRVYKNLRVCPDCHTATKFISKVTGREIIARDLNRFHHFKDGMCSCGDYW